MHATTKSLLPARLGWKSEDDNDIASLRRAMNDLFEGFGNAWDVPAFRPSGETAMTWSPRLDMVEEENELCIHVELPGLDEKDIDISLTGDVLTIKGRKVYEKKDESKGTWFRSERGWGEFLRTVPLPFAVDRDHVKAAFKKGVLTIKLPKSAEAKESVRKIPIKET